MCLSQKKNNETWQEMALKKANIFNKNLQKPKNHLNLKKAYQFLPKCTCKADNNKQLENR